MKPSTPIFAAALVALGIVAQPADARIAAGLNLSTHTMRADTVMPLGHSGGMRHMRKFNDDPPDDPPPKKTPTGTTGNGSGTGNNSGTGSGNPYPYYGPHHHGSGYWDPYGRWHPYPNSNPPSACSDPPC